MASSGKKGKKPKGKTIALTDFLADGAAPGAIQTAVRSRAWADEVENDDDMFDMGGRNKQPVILPTAPRATREPNVDDENIPRNPPFNAYISNLQYDVDEEEITEFFADMVIVNVRLPRDDRGSGRLKGFGYVEFETRDSLIAALSMGDTTIKGRRMRIEVASSSDGGNDRRRGGNDRGYDNRDAGGPDRTQGDWRSGPREEPASGERPGGFGRDNVDASRDRGSFTRDNMDGPKERGSFTRDNMDGPKDRGAFTRDNMDGPKDRGSFTRDNMDGPKDRGAFTRDNMDGPKDRGSFTRDNMNGPRDRGTFTRDNMDGPKDRGAFTRDNMDGPRERGDSRSFTRDGMDGGGFNGRRDGSYDNRGGGRGGGQDEGSGFRGGYGGGDGYRERDRYGGGGGGGSWGGDRDRGGDFGPRRTFNKDDRELPEVGLEKPAEQKTRPKLNLAQRSVPDTTDEAPPAQAAIFGGARPVDTAAREREIEERLAKQNQPSRLESDKGERTEKEKPEEPPIAVAKRAEPAQPPSENAWQRRAAQQAADGVGNNVHEQSRPPRDTDQLRRTRQYDNMGRGMGRGMSRGAPNVGVGARVAKREPRKDCDELSRMPKVREQAAPNFIVSNKYGLLPSEEDANE